MIKKAVILLFWLILWQVAAALIHNPIYLPSMTDTVAGLFGMLTSLVFWKAVANSLLRILSGFLAAVLSACIFAQLSLRFPLIKDVSSPVISLVGSVPGAAVAVLLLIWLKNPYAVFTAVLITVFPHICKAMMKGIDKAADALSVSLRIGIGSGIAAEMIGMTRSSIGEQLYRDKIYLNTVGILSWIAVILTLSVLIEKLILTLFRMITHAVEAWRTGKAGSGEPVSGDNKSGDVTC